MKISITLLSLFLPVLLSAQLTFTGNVSDVSGKPLPFATVALLYPGDSTLAFFGITDTDGRFAVKQVKQGNYLLQVSFIGYKTYYNQLDTRKISGEYGVIVLQQKPIDLPEAEIAGEYIPLSIRQDTVEYNAGAFKTKPDAVAEDLLKKLPGVEVDRAGNIKAMGEDVRNVMVDGKEFFSSDPKVATKNLPADAISKVQVYDKKSEASELADMDDGSREKTINLLLKDGKKQAWLGQLTAGGGTGNHYDLSGKAYRFTQGDQFAVLGMINNINKFGFSFQDYLDFNGGIQALSSGGHMKFSFNFDDDMPVNFGQTVEGLVTSGAGGLNYSFEPVKNGRLYMSYLGNGSHRDLQRDESSINYTSGGKYLRESETDRQSRNYSHRINLGWKDKSDSTRTTIFNGNVGLTDSWEEMNAIAKAKAGEDVINTLVSTANAERDNLSAGGSLSSMYKGAGVFRLWNFSLNGNYKTAFDNNDRINLLTLPDLDPIEDHGITKTENQSVKTGASASTLIRLSGKWYINPKLKADYLTESFSRQLKRANNGQDIIDSLSPALDRYYLHVLPEISVKYTTKKTKLTAGAVLLSGISENKISDSPVRRELTQILPYLNIEYDYQTGKRISIDYNSEIQEPDIALFVPVADNSNPQSLFYGNRSLKPSYIHNLFGNWLLYDQFSQTSLFARAGVTYTQDKPGYSVDILEDLTQITRIINTDEDYAGNAGLEFTTPLRFAGVNMHLELSGRIDRGEGFVNGNKNTTTSTNRSINLSFTNRKTQKWNIEAGAEIDITNTKWSLQQSLDNRYLSLNYYASIEFTPDERWRISVNADVVNYTAESFGGSVSIPMIGAEMSYNFLKSKRAGLTLSAFDLLNKNTGIRRISELNYLSETRSNIIKRYVMLSFSYKLNKATGNNDRIDIKVKQ